MKKSILLFALSISTLISCSKSDDNPSTTPIPNIVGNWDLKAHMLGTTDFPLDYCEERDSQFRFYSNLTVVETTGYSNSNTGRCDNDIYQETYSVSNNVLTIIRVLNPISYFRETRYNILELTSAKLKLKLFYVKEKQGENPVYEENIPENEQITFLFDKI